MDPHFLEKARSGGASPEQVAILDDNEVTFGEYQSAVDRALACIREAGIEVIGDSVTESQGFPEIAYAFGAESAGRTSDQTIAIADDCITTHSQFVESAYQTSPASVEAAEAGFAPYRAAVVSCMRDAGGRDVEDDAGRTEVIIAADVVKRETGVDCVVEAGYQG